MSSSENFARLPHVHHFYSLGAIVSLFDHRRHFRRPRIHEPHPLILTSCGIIIPLVIPNDILTQILHFVKGGQFLRRLHIPKFHGIIAARARQHVRGGGMKSQQIHLLGMPHKIDHAFGNIAPRLARPLFADGLPVVGNAPYFDGGILARRGQHGIVEGVPFEIQNGAVVAVEGGSGAGDEPAWTIVSADVDDTAAPEEGHGEVFRGGLDILLVARYC
mmetsp:Transcript_35485/g.85619  ORF Transcript_35485/g.85619 Transcript_35485/m.85619 type:complete len:218 (+) Transcript_35485:1005-1658(+)